MTSASNQPVAATTCSSGPVFGPEAFPSHALVSPHPRAPLAQGRFCPEGFARGIDILLGRIQI
jgi:hypothetical protein